VAGPDGALPVEIQQVALQGPRVSVTHDGLAAEPGERRGGIGAVPGQRDVADLRELTQRVDPEGR